MRFFIGIIIMCFVGSCASLGKGVFIKRKYNKGYHIDLASHKTSEPKTTVEPKEKVSQPEEKEIVIVEKQTIDTKQEEIHVEKEMPQTSSNYRSAFGSTTSNRETVHGDVKQTLVKKVTTFKTQASDYTGSKFAVGVILFLILTLIYALAIVVRNPGFPFGLALVIGMLGALLTMLTGRVFM